MSDHTVVCVFEDGQSRSIRAREQETIYQACLRHDLPLLVDCKEGACGTCKARCGSGDYWLDDISDEALSDEEQEERFVLTCQMHATSDCLIEFPYPLPDEARQPKPMAARVTAVEPIGGAVVRLLVQVEGEPPAFLPGQYVNIAIPGTGEVRSYSFANAPGARSLEFFVRLLPGGAMSDYLRDRARPGDALTLSGPFGAFFLRPPARPVLMVAGGTGLAPMLSMLDTLAVTADPPPVTLLYGANLIEDLFGEARVAASGLPVDLRRCVVEGGDGWEGPVGHVTALLEPSLLESGEPDVYLCGPPPMIDAAKTWLRGQRVPDGRIYAEKFLPSGVSAGG